MKKLFMIGVGGSVKGANVEVHAMQFVFADTFTDTFEELQKRWYGDSLHVDGFTELKYIDNYEIDLSSDLKENLYMIVYGGYKKGVIDELHTYSFQVASNETEAKKKAKEIMGNFKYMDHVDQVVNVFDVCGKRFGLVESNKKFEDNEYTHIFVKLQ